MDMPIWNKVCPECGAQQLQLVSERNLAFERTKADAESKLEACEFDAAKELAESLGSQTDPRFQQQVAWIKQFLEGLESHKAERLNRVGEVITEAMRHEEAHDYAAAIHALNQVPQPLRGVAIMGPRVRDFGARGEMWRRRAGVARGSE